MNTPPHRAPQSIGPFEVVATIGRGATAIVYKVRHKPTGKFAALKIGPCYAHLEDGAVERFQQEFTAIQPLQHPNVVRALATGKEDGAPYLVMEYVPDHNLHERLEQKGALSTAETAAIFQQVAAGLRYLHANGILHRDIKPSNIFLTNSNKAKLGDFGLLKNLNQADHITRSRQAMGTIDYGAPEQFEDAKRVDHRCDLYSLAATLYTALTGKFPFGQGNSLQILQRKLLGQFVPLRLVLPALDPAIDRLVGCCLQPRPAARPRGCDEIIAILDRWDTQRENAASAGEIAVPTNNPARGAERRAVVRFAVDLTATFVPFHQNMRGRWEAAVLDVSASGVCLRTARAVAVNSVLQVTLARRAGAELVLVRWITPADADGSLIAGCSFVRTLSQDEVEAICRGSSGPERPASKPQRLAAAPSAASAR